MKAKTIQMRWHDQLPILSVDFEPKSSVSGRNELFSRLVTSGSDGYVRIWKISESEFEADSDKDLSGLSFVKVTVLANLNRHQKAVNVARFSPSGERLATSGDDGALIVWRRIPEEETKSESPPIGDSSLRFDGPLSGEQNTDSLHQPKEQDDPHNNTTTTTATATATASSSNGEDDLPNLESWSVLMIKYQPQDVYDLVWSPDNLYVVTVSVDNVVRLWDIQRSKCIKEIKEHGHYVQGVAWDPLGSYIATQSSDRSCRIFKIKLLKRGGITCNAMIRHIKTEFDDHVWTRGDQEAEMILTRKKVLASFHDETLTSFFRRPTFSPDGNLLFASAGLIEDPEKTIVKHGLFIYARDNLSQPIGHISGYQKPVIGIRCCPVLFDKRSVSPTPFRVKKQPIVNLTENNKENQEIHDRNQDILFESFKFTALFDLPYRMLFAVATQDTVVLYDTQQPMPIAYWSHYHYASITDVAWSCDARYIVFTSMDGYATIVRFSGTELGIPLSEDNQLVYTTPKPLETTTLCESTPLATSVSLLNPASPLLQEPEPEKILNEQQQQPSLSVSSDQPILNLPNSSSIDETNNAKLNLTSLSGDIKRRRIQPSLLRPL